MSVTNRTNDLGDIISDSMFVICLISGIGGAVVCIIGVVLFIMLRKKKVGREKRKVVEPGT